MHRGDLGERYKLT